nr:MAG TPA: hypothetical protein [Caudoviricetes sp.]
MGIFDNYVYFMLYIRKIFLSNIQLVNGRRL